MLIATCTEPRFVAGLKPARRSTTWSVACWRSVSLTFQRRPWSVVSTLVCTMLRGLVQILLFSPLSSSFLLFSPLLISTHQLFFTLNSYTSESRWNSPRFNYVTLSLFPPISFCCFIILIQWLVCHNFIVIWPYFYLLVYFIILCCRNKSGIRYCLY